MELIDKAALVAEINRRILDAPIDCYGHQRVYAYNDVKSIINTLKDEAITKLYQDFSTSLTIDDILSWLEKQKDYEDELEKAYKTADEVQYRRGYEAAKREFEKQGEMKPQSNSALEIWKDMRLEVYQQASGNRHEPNYSDDSTKMFSLADIDEIFEKVAEKQGEQKPVMEGTFVNVDEVREDFVSEIYRVLDTDLTNERANQIIDAFDGLPTVKIQNPAKWSEDDDSVITQYLNIYKRGDGKLIPGGIIYPTEKSAKEGSLDGLYTSFEYVKTIIIEI